FMHPLLGVIAALGAGVIAAIALLTERLTRHAAGDVLQKSRSASRHVETLARNAEVIVGMGMTQAALGAWQTRQDGLLAARARQGLQLAMLGTGAWLVIGADASAGIMVAATILLGRALQPLELLVGGWRALLDARGAWRRLNERARVSASGGALELPAPNGRLQVERVVFGPVPMRPALIKGVGFTLEPGESLGLVGPSASGKTTLLRLILGL